MDAGYVTGARRWQDEGPRLVLAGVRLMLTPLAQAFGVSVEELVGAPIKRAGKWGPTPKLQQQIERLSDLPQAKQRLVIEMLEGVLQSNR